MDRIITILVLCTVFSCVDSGDSMNSILNSEQRIVTLPAIDSTIPEHLDTATFALG